MLEAAAGGIDARIIRPRPAPDGELTPTVTFLDDLLAADLSEEPPMRDASGKLVEVRVREPWNMHALTADGTNSTGKDSEAIATPIEPILVQLSPPAVELMIRAPCPVVRGNEGGAFALVRCQERTLMR